MVKYKKDFRSVLPENVVICECFARDGLQREQYLPTKDKIAIINRFSEAGFKKIEVTSFAHPKFLPQFKDAGDVLTRIERVEGIKYLALVPNEKGFDRLLSLCERGCGADGIIMVITASESYNKKNVGRTVDETMFDIANISRRAGENGLYIIGCIGTSFGCPIEGDIPPARVLELARRYEDMGVDEIMFGDTTGMANPLKVSELFNLLSEKIKAAIIAHFHDTRGMGLANVYAALQSGIRNLDSSIGGSGGGIVKETLQAHSGNIATEDLLCMLEEMGIRTEIELDMVLECVSYAEKSLDRRLDGRVSKIGKIRH